MRGALLTIGLGLVAGLVGAGVFARFLSGPKPVPVAAREDADRRRSPVIVPAGWDPALLARLTQLEGDVANVKSALKPAKETSPASEPASAFQQEKLRNYQRDLDDQQQKLADHQSEALDQGWAEGQAAEFSRALSALEIANVSSVGRADCRSKSCVVRLTYSSPTVALAQRGAFEARAAVPGCKGFTSALQPPEGDGAYEMMAIYNCR